MAKSHRRGGRQKGRGDNISQGSAGSPRHLAIEFDGFGWEAVEAMAARDQNAIEGVITKACDHYVSELEVDRLATELPRTRLIYDGREERRLELYLSTSVSRALERESARQGVAVSGIVEHAILLYMADLDLREASVSH